MNRKNVIRTLTAIAVVLLLGWSFFYFSNDTRGYKPVDTSVAMTQIKSGNVKSAQIDDREQQVRLTLKSANGGTDGSDKIITKYPTGYAVPLFDALTSTQGRAMISVCAGSGVGGARSSPRRRMRGPPRPSKCLRRPRIPSRPRNFSWSTTS
jgi:cell division protease FtsH